MGRRAALLRPSLKAVTAAPRPGFHGIGHSRFGAGGQPIRWHFMSSQIFTSIYLPMCTADRQQILTSEGTLWGLAWLAFTRCFVTGTNHGRAWARSKD